MAKLGLVGLETPILSAECAAIAGDLRLLPLKNATAPSRVGFNP
jgi:hypothetical protein